MRKTHDYIHAYRGIWRDGGRCRIEIYAPDRDEAGRPPVIVASELPANDNTSITNLAEVIAAEVIARHFPHLLDQPATDEQPVLWVEHYPKERTFGGEYDLVTFTPWRITDSVGGRGAAPHARRAPLAPAHPGGGDGAGEPPPGGGERALTVVPSGATWCQLRRSTAAPGPMHGHGVRAA